MLLPEVLGTLGIEYSLSPGRPRQIHGALRAATASPAASELGHQLSDDSLTISPDGPAARRIGLGAFKRDARARPGSGKRMAISASPSRSLGRHFRKASPAHVDWDAPRNRAPQRPEDRIERLEKALAEHTQIGLELRRQLFSKFGALES